MKIYIVNGRKVWLDKAPEGVAEVKPEVKKDEPKADAETKAKPATANKGRKASANKAKKDGAK